MTWISVHMCSFACGCPVVLELFIEKPFFLVSLSKISWLALNVWVSFWILSSDFLALHEIHPVSVPHYITATLFLKSGSVSLTSLFFLILSFCPFFFFFLVQNMNCKAKSFSKCKGPEIISFTAKEEERVYWISFSFLVLLALLIFCKLWHSLPFVSVETQPLLDFAFKSLRFY